MNGENTVSGLTILHEERRKREGKERELSYMEVLSHGDASGIQQISSSIPTAGATSTYSFSHPWSLSNRATERRCSCWVDVLVHQPQSTYPASLNPPIISYRSVATSLSTSTEWTRSCSPIGERYIQGKGPSTHEQE
jgi:hypothetical protein